MDKKYMIPARAVFPIPEGVAILELPHEISDQSESDLREWFDLLLKQAKRSLEAA